MRGQVRYLLLLLLVLTGCTREARLAEKGETDDPDYQYAVQLKWRGRPGEALSYFRKVIDQRGDAAPESFLDAGLIYLEDLQQPLDAYIYLKKYLELRPNAENKDLVEQRIEIATRELLRNLPVAIQGGSGGDRMEFLDEIDRLRRENDRLQTELLALRSSAGTPRTSRTEVSLNPIPASTAVPVISPVVAPTVTLPLANESTPPPSTPASASRTHTVVQGETLYQLSRRYYPQDLGAGVERIREANRDQLRGDDIFPGMVLRIP